MTVARVKPSGWALNEKLTSAQQNAVDTNITYVLDKRQGETDTLSSTITVDGYADITYQSGSVITHEADSIETYDTDSAVYLHGLSDFDGFSAHQSGDIVNFYSGSLENHLSGSVDHYASGAMMINDGYGEFTDLRLSGTSVVNYKTPRTFVRKFYGNPDRLSEFSTSVPGIINIETQAVGAIITLDLGACGIPNRATLTQIKVYYAPPTGHVGLPSQPTMTIYRSLISSVNSTILNVVYSLYASVPTYEVFGYLGTGTVANVLDFDNYAYTVWFKTEYGTNSIAGTIIYGFEVTFEAPSMNDY